MGFLDILTGDDSPDYGDPALDPRARAMIQEQHDRAMNSTPKDLEKAYLTGVDDAKGLLKDSGQFDQGLGYGNKALTEAIQKKFSKGAERSIQRTKESAGDKAKSDHFNRLQNVAKLVGDEQQLNQQKAIMKYQAKMNRQRARAAIVGQVLGIGGAVAGGMMGGPMGAMAGYSIGQGAGGVAAGGAE